MTSFPLLRILINILTNFYRVSRLISPVSSYVMVVVPTLMTILFFPLSISFLSILFFLSLLEVRFISQGSPNRNFSTCTEYFYITGQPKGLFCIQDSPASLGAGFGSALLTSFFLRIPAHPRGAYIRGRLTPATDTDLLLTAYRGGSHLPLI